METMDLQWSREPKELHGEINAKKTRNNLANDKHNLYLNLNRNDVYTETNFIRLGKYKNNNRKVKVCHIL